MPPHNFGYVPEDQEKPKRKQSLPNNGVWINAQIDFALGKRKKIVYIDKGPHGDLTLRVASVVLMGSHAITVNAGEGKIQTIMPYQIMGWGA
jgi:hypothetical protein